MSWLSSALTAPGTSAAKSDSNKKKIPQKAAVSYLTPLMDANSFGAAGQTAANAMPIYNRTIGTALGNANPWGVQRGVDTAREGMVNAAQMQAPSISQLFARSGGGGIGAVQGAQLNAIDEANRRANEMQTFWASPAGRTALAENVSKLTDMATNSPIMNMLSQIASIIYGRPAPQVGASPAAGILGGATSLLSGGAFPNLFGAGVGGAAGKVLSGSGSNTSNSGVLPGVVTGW